MTISAATGASSGVPASASLNMQDFLKVLLTQLTYQDPLKPMDNFQFVSQLAQFSQIQIGQTTNDKLATLVTAQGTAQAAGLLGRIVDIPSGSGVISGKVTAISFANGDPQLTITTGDQQTISGLSLANVSQIRQGN